MIMMTKTTPPTPAEIAAMQKTKAIKVAIDSAYCLPGADARRPHYIRLDVDDVQDLIDSSRLAAMGYRATWHDVRFKTRIVLFESATAWFAALVTSFGQETWELISPEGDSLPPCARQVFWDEHAGEFYTRPERLDHDLVKIYVPAGWAHLANPQASTDACCCEINVAQLDWLMGTLHIRNLGYQLADPTTLNKWTSIDGVASLSIRKVEETRPVYGPGMDPDYPEYEKVMLKEVSTTSKIDLATLPAVQAVNPWCPASYVKYIS